MSFQLVDPKSSQLLWVPVTGTSELYVGQLVEWSGEGVDIIDVASGAFDTTGETAIAGIVVATNNRTKVYEDGTTVAGFSGEEITGVVTQADQIARNNFGQGGMYAKHERLAMVQIALLDGSTRIRGRIYNGAYGTAPTLLTATAINANGLTETTNACDFTPVADFATIYCRTGANAGLYRVTDDLSTTICTHDHAWPLDATIGDTFVRVPIKQGLSRLQVDSSGLWIDATATPATNYYGALVDYMDLRTATEEYCEFRFAAIHFAGGIG